MTSKRSFAPVVDANTRILILGSLPGEISLAHGQYYANRQNRFWALLGQVIGEDLPNMEYPMRLETLLRHRVGLWDVVAEAHRNGSLDSNIRNHSGNDLIGLTQNLPNLIAIAFNGGTAAKIGQKQLGQHAEHYRIIKLPSSSPAHTMSFTEKLSAWLVLQDLLA
jgi:hypoxanthine-DNA glycosylase